MRGVKLAHRDVDGIHHVLPRNPVPARHRAAQRGRAAAAHRAGQRSGPAARQRNARWADSRRRYDAGYGVKTLEALQAVVAFFEERRGQLYGFRWRDRLDHSSAAPGAPVSPLDQGIGTGDGATAAFQLVKTYGAGFAPYAREIAKPVAGSVRVAVAGSELRGHGVQLRCDHRRRDVSRRPYSGRRRRDHRGISVRRAGAVRHRLSRSRPLGVRGGRDPENSAGGDTGVTFVVPPCAGPMRPCAQFTERLSQRPFRIGDALAAHGSGVAAA